MNVPCLDPYFEQACPSPFSGPLPWTSRREGSHPACKGGIPHTAPPSQCAHALCPGALRQRQLQ